MSFDVREATVDSIQAALYSGQASCRDVVEAFIARIEAHNPKLNAVISLNPDALTDADEADAKLLAQKETGKLFGVPVLVKDNIDTAGMPTTAGSLALRDAWPRRDASIITALREAGAIILGKTNLHELALEGLTVSSYGGQTINPYDFTRTPGGSSGGSAAAVAASFAVMATGTDTVNSLRNPASANSLYSFRPTRGLISRAGVAPVSSTQDAVGMIGRSLGDIAAALTVMASVGHDNQDSSTNDIPNSVLETDYAQFLRSSGPTPMSFLRIGILNGFLDHSDSQEAITVNRAIQNVKALLIKGGATVVLVNDKESFDAPSILSTMDTQMFEMRNLMDSYLSSPGLRGAHPTSWSEIFKPSKVRDKDDSYGSSSNETSSNFLVIPSQYPYISTALRSSTWSTEYSTRKARIAQLTHNLHDLFRTHNLDAIIYPQQRHLVMPIGASRQTGRNGILAAVTGSPVVCIPIGFSEATSTAPIGIPIGMEILGMPWSEGRLLEVARAIDEQLQARKPPLTAGLNDKVEVKVRYERVPHIVPSGLKSVDIVAYPPGRTQ